VNLKDFEEYGEDEEYDDDEYVSSDEEDPNALIIKDKVCGRGGGRQKEAR
jgi:hypothetical protein